MVLYCGKMLFSLIIMFIFTLRKLLTERFVEEPPFETFILFFYRCMLKRADEFNDE